MSDRDTILEIDGLKIEFELKSGTVYAIDGVDLEVKKGEVIGLVGESGCGKSVTANSILRLVPTPPGVYRAGSIYLGLPHELQAKRAALKKMEMERGKDDPQCVKERKSIAEDLAHYDILKMDTGQLRNVRGNMVSMIFQEPMSSLNPVFTAGDQIAEIMLLHERRDLAKAVMARMDEQSEKLKGYKRVRKINTSQSAPQKKNLTGDSLGGGYRESVSAENNLPLGKYICSGCKAPVSENDEVCPQCGGFFDPKPFRFLTRLRNSYYRMFYKMVQDNPDMLFLRITRKIPVVRGYEKAMNAEALRRAEHMLRLVRVPDPHNVITSYPYELSGGMQQRVMIAMALACKPKLLIADEPTTALDVTIQAQILTLMRELQEKTGTTILMITHNLAIIAEICDRVGVMYAGNIAEVASTSEIFKEPLHPYTQGLMNSIPRVDANLTRLETIEGNVPNLAKPPMGCRFHPRCPYAMEMCTKVKPILTEVRPNHTVACHLYTEGAA